MLVKNKSGFTLIELLAVIAIIGILAGLLLSAIGVARRQAGIVKTRARFIQYAIAYEQFRAEYGFYPSMGQDSPSFSLKDNNDVFVETLSGSTLAGSAPADPYALQANPRRINFYRFPSSDLGSAQSGNPGQIVDAFGNPNIVIVIDSDADGVIPAEDLPARPDGTAFEPINSGVAVYSDNSSGNPDWKWIFSWE